MTPTFELDRDYCRPYNAPSLPKFHHPMFTRLEVIMLTNKHKNKETDAAEKNPTLFSTLRRWVIISAFVDVRLK